VRKFLTILTILAAFAPLFVFAGAAAAYDEAMYIFYEAKAGFSGGKTSYSNAAFSGARFQARQDKPLVSSEIGEPRGTLTIQDGSYSYTDAAGKLFNVKNGVPEAGAESSFVLSCSGGASDYTAFEPSLGDFFITRFIGPADGGLRGSNFNWQVSGAPLKNSTVPDFKTVSEQLESYVPYVEFASDGRNFNWKMVKSDDKTRSPRPIDKAGVITVTARYKSGVPRVASKNFAAGSVPSGDLTVTSTSSYDPENLVSVQVDFDWDDSQDNVVSVYSWIFTASGGGSSSEVLDKFDESDNGLTDETLLSVFTQEHEIPAMNTKNLEIAFKVDYTSYVNPSSDPSSLEYYRAVQIADESVAAFDSWTSAGGNSYKLSLRGLKAGSTEVVILYRTSVTKEYFRTTPISVKVTSAGDGDDDVSDGNYGNTGEDDDEWNDAEGGSHTLNVDNGSCNAGFGAAPLLLLAALPLRRRK
jgi:hypothetical protein